jgi:hypothetical protein
MFGSQQHWSPGPVRHRARGLALSSDGGPASGVNCSEKIWKTNEFDEEIHLSMADFHGFSRSMLVTLEY